MAICDNMCNILAPIVVASVNNHDNVLFNSSFFGLLETCDLLGIDLKGSAITFDAGFDTEVNRQTIRGQGLIPIIKRNRRGTKDPEKLEQMFLLNEEEKPIYQERYRIERCYAWEDTYRRLVIRYEKLPIMHMGFKELAYSMINLRWLLGKKRHATR